MRNANRNGENVYTQMDENVNRVSTDQDEAILAEIRNIIHSDLKSRQKCAGIAAFFPDLHFDPEPTPVQLARRRAWAVWEKTNGKCAYCDCALNPFDRNAHNGFHIDHVIPRARGGGDEIENLAPACSRCNFSKYARTPEEWRGK